MKSLSAGKQIILKDKMDTWSRAEQKLVSCSHVNVGVWCFQVYPHAREYNPKYDPSEILGKYVRILY